MNNITPPPLIPGEPPHPTPYSPVPPLGSLPEDRPPVTNALSAVEALLRQPRRVLYQLTQPGAGRLILFLWFLTLTCSLIYGLVVGSFSMGTQLWAAPLKVAVGLMVATVICLPSLYIFACLSGSQARLIEIIGLVFGLVTLLSVLLIGFAPVAWLFSQSTQSICWMGALHLIFCLVATIFGLRFLASGFACSRARSSGGLVTWAIIFILVLLQMTTALRPLVGKSDTFFPAEKKFFLKHWADCIDAKPDR
jgi:hypothetical protein